MNGIGRKLVWLLLPLVGACDADDASSNTGVATSSDAPAAIETAHTETSGHTVEPSTDHDTADHDTAEPNSESNVGTGSQGAANGGATSGASADASESTIPAVVGERVLGARCERAERLGAFAVRLDTDRTTVGGGVSNGVLPSSVPAVAAEGGGCELLVPRNLLCTSCGSTQACAGDDVCVAKPARVSAGTLRVEGLLTDLEVAPNGITTEYSKTVLDPFPAYVPGDTLKLHADGDVVSAFEAELIGVPPLTSSLTSVAVKQGEPAVLSWDAEASNPEETAIFVSFSVNVHGAVTGWIECTAPDNGEFEIPAELVSQLIDLGSSGFPRVDLERRSSATVDLESGCVDLFVASEITLDIDLEGLSSCNEDQDCESDQTCNDQKVCE